LYKNRNNNSYVKNKLNDHAIIINNKIEFVQKPSSDQDWIVTNCFLVRSNNVFEDKTGMVGDTRFYFCVTRALHDIVTIYY